MKNVLVFRHVPHEGLGTLESFLKSRKASIQYCDLFQNSVIPSNPGNFNFIISMGGPMNADETDRYPFLGAERQFLQKAIQQGKSVFGICLGSQLIARALNAKVYAGPKKEIGWYPITFSETAKNSSIFSAVSKENPVVFQWHGDTFDLPAGAERLASSVLYQNQAFRFGQNVYAFQFHIEITPEIVAEWADENKDELASLKPPQTKTQLLKDAEKYMGSLARLADKIYPTLYSA